MYESVVFAHEVHSEQWRRALVANVELMSETLVVMSDSELQCSFPKANNRCTVAGAYVEITRSQFTL